ncbi:hypothetical protein ACHAXA_010586 [Cyclostephanos tholiformis]|uniref:Uncharacterized protein n=1 Tax=Cyclostephanos tholiformis TaxID=382380 RepID=A0ABD3RZD1_9STRA
MGLGTSISKSISPSSLSSLAKTPSEPNAKSYPTLSPPANAHVRINTEVPVIRISVCAGELCQCQGEKYEVTGGAADAAIKALQSFDFSFPVDEVGCMGACGMGTMIAIDYENGDSIMTDGLESTLKELGIRRKTDPFAFETWNTIIESNEAKDEASLVRPPLLADARDRMRQEVADEVENPWIKMASYLARKAAGKIFGPE